MSFFRSRAFEKTHLKEVHQANRVVLWRYLQLFSLFFMSALIWFNEDGLNPEHPMVKDYPDAPKVYVFDLPYLQQWQIAKHRIQFIYESLLETPDIQIYKGETVPILRQLLAEHQATDLITTETPNHLIRTWQSELRQHANLITYPERYPVTDTTSPRRFSRYWRKHDRAWLTP
jgi:hypothetical protein